MKKISIISLSVIVVAFIFGAVGFVFAARDIGDAPGLLDIVSKKAGVEQKTVPEAAGGIIAVAMSLTALIFFILMVYAGFKWMLAQGEEDKIKKARDTLVMAVIGLLILISSYAISIFISKGIIDGEGLGDEAGGKDNSVTVCCLDQVKAGGDSSFDVHFAHWAWRITSQDDCKRRGDDPNDPGDVLYGAGTWEAIECGSKNDDACAIMCEEIWDKK